MNTRPRLVRSIPFWLLIAGSLTAAVVGTIVLLDKLAAMEKALTEGTTTGIEIYLGQVWGVVGAVLIGAGVLGLGLAAALGALRAALPHEIAEAVSAYADDAPAAAQEEEPAIAPVAGGDASVAPASAAPTTDR
ncbi:dinucleotide-utilizing enzyme [Microbacterium sp. 179-B 1A2 NHS]|uniref:dinucleotide-utilizing enzyme n=1 Tax=Microbacterium sp. 179-B 1A2 NHS TaxID=3142383 RepID=UPI0039A181FC